MKRDLFNNMVCEVRVDLYQRVPSSKLPKIVSSKDAYDLVSPGWEEMNYRERFKVMFLNRGNKVIGIREISAGGLTGTVIDVRNILQAALGVNASSMILMHNHPSGTLQASDADIRITRKIKDAATIMDISVLDHLIFTEEKYLSFADEGLL